MAYIQSTSNFDNKTGTSSADSTTSLYISISTFWTSIYSIPLTMPTPNWSEMAQAAAR